MDSTDEFRINIWDRQLVLVVLNCYSCFTLQSCSWQPICVHSRNRRLLRGILFVESCCDISKWSCWVDLLIARFRCSDFFQCFVDIFRVWCIFRVDFRSENHSLLLLFGLLLQDAIHFILRHFVALGVLAYSLHCCVYSGSCDSRTWRGFDGRRSRKLALHERPQSPSNERRTRILSECDHFRRGCEWAWLKLLKWLIWLIERRSKPKEQSMDAQYKYWIESHTKIPPITINNQFRKVFSSFQDTNPNQSIIPWRKYCKRITMTEWKLFLRNLALFEAINDNRIYECSIKSISFELLTLKQTLQSNEKIHR